MKKKLTTCRSEAMKVEMIFYSPVSDLASWEMRISRTERSTDETGALRRFVNVFVSDEDVRFLDGLDTAVPEGGTVAIVPAVAGG